MVIVHEMYRQRRIIPIDGRPRTGIAQWNGEARGRWGGGTLVVESRHCPDRAADRFRHVWRAPTASLHLVERFTRVDAATIDYEATIADPTRFARPWTVPLDGLGARVGVTRVRLVHLLELREALAAAYRAAGRSSPGWTDVVPSAGAAPIRAVHLMELRTAVLALE